MSSPAIPSFDEFVASGTPKKQGIPTFDQFVAPAPRNERVGGQKVLDYANDTLSNVPSSAAKLAGNIGNAILHPIDTVGGIVKAATGTFEKMTPDTPSHAGRSNVPYADAAGAALKDRYGSPSAIAETIRTDPVGVAADASALAGGVSGLARGGGAIARAANLPRVASGAAKVAETAGAISDAVNPISLATKPIGAVLKQTAKPLVKSALGLPGRTERYGATPAAAALEHTSGITPSAVKESAIAQLNGLNQELEGLAAASGNTADLTAARKVIADAIAKVQAANGSADDLLPMQKQLTEARPGFAGAKTAAGDVAPQQAPIPFLGMKRQFGDDFTKFDAAAPLKDSTRKVGNQAYHELSSEFNRAVPGAADINQQIQSLAPVKDAAQRTSENAGAVQRSINRATRPTGGLAATLFGLHEAGVPGALAAMALQEGLASPTVKMGIARMLFGAGKGIKSPLTPRALNATGVAGEAADGSIPHYAKGGIAGMNGPEIALVGEEGPEQITPLSANLPTVPEAPGTIAEQVHQLSSGKRRVVMLPKGTPMLSTYQDKHGNQYVFNPNMISRNTIHAAAQTNNLTKILGASHGGMGAPDKSKLRGGVKAVVGKSASGITTQATATDRRHLRSALKQTRKVTPVGGRVSVTSPVAAVGERLLPPGPVR